MVQMTRRVAFSSGHRYWIPNLSDEENRALFGEWASRFNHGHNYVLDVTVEGKVDPQTGMVVNIKRVDDLLKEKIVRQFDQKSINDEIPAFQSKSSSLENLMFFIRDELSDKAGNLAVAPVPGGDASALVRLVRIRLEETPLLWGELSFDNGETMTLTRVFEFAAAHRLDSRELTEEENLALYGKCNNPAGHGHNYVLEVTVEGKPDPRTGMMLDLGELDRTVERLVVDRYDHRNLDVDIPEFQGRITTSEVVAEEIFRRLKAEIPSLSRIRLHETARNIFEVSA